MNGKSLILLFIFSIKIIGQVHSANITGKVIDENSKKGIQLANVFVLNSTDSSLISGEATLKDGSFNVKNIPEGSYNVKVTSIGYKEQLIKDIIIDKKTKKKELGEIELKPTVVDIEEILVSSKKETFNNSIDRKIYNVEKDVMSKTGTASELLQNIPSVQVDIDGNITLRGAGNAVIMINGKTSPLLAKSAPAVLEQMPANSIEKIEVITNPSAKYKPDGNSGIINIVLKKNSSLGMNGSVSGNAGAKSRYNGNVSLNYNPGAINLYGTYGFRQDDRSRYNTDNRQLNNTSSGTVYYNDKSSGGGRPFFQMTSGGFDYSINKTDKFGASFNYMYHDFTREEVNTKNTLNSNLTLIEDYDRIRTETQDEKEFEASLNYQHNFPEEDHVLKAEFKYSYSPELENNKYTNNFRIPNQVTSFEKTTIYQTGLLKNIEIEYSNPLTETAKLEAGYAGEFDTPEFSYKGEYYSDIMKSYVKDFTKTNHYVMDEQINALYATLGNSFGQFGILAGLRLENAYVKSHLINNDSSIVNKMFNLFPTLHLSYKFNETSQLQLNYSKRVNRPEGDDLNPFPEYQDPRNIRSGNPNLLPEFYHSVELGYQKEFEHFTFLQSIYYKYTNNKFTSVIRPINDTVFLTTLQNLSSDQSAGLEFIFSANHNGFISSNLSANVFYSEIDASNIGYSSKKSTVAWSGSWNVNINAAKSTLLQLNSNFRSVRLTPQGEYNASYVVNLGCRQDLFDEKLSLIFTISDLFNSLKRKMNLDTQMLKQNTVSERDSRIFYFGFTYHFGGSERKSKERKLEYDDKL